MGTYHDYIVAPDLFCPKCSKPMAGWQGTDGPCRLVRWKQGEITPAHYHPETMSATDASALRLPREFTINGGSCQCSSGFAALCRTDASGRWVTTEIITSDEQRDFYDSDWRT